ncbi:hypothetical protein U8607_23100 [Methylobacterium durans]|nr:hypothetical protein [Methylobacterium durans]MEA1834987.1 hypothetical protein [Methylobacterium durans]
MTANDPTHRQGQSVNTVDQLSSVTLLGIALAGAGVAVGIFAMIS